MASQTAHPYRTLSFCWDPSWGAASPPSPDGGRGAARLCVLNLIWPPRGVSEKHLQLPHGQNSATPLPVPFPFLASPVCPDHQVLMSLCSPCSHPAQVTPPSSQGVPLLHPLPLSNASRPSRLQVSHPCPSRQRASLVPISAGGSRPLPQLLPRDVVLLQCTLCVETPSSSSPAPAALPCGDMHPCLLSCTHPATKCLAFFGSPAELNISHLFL